MTTNNTFRIYYQPNKVSQAVSIPLSTIDSVGTVYMPLDSHCKSGFTTQLCQQIHPQGKSEYVALWD